MRFLFSCLSSYGFVYPAIGLAQLLHERGHEVALVTGPGFSETIIKFGLRRIPRGPQDGESFDGRSWAAPLSIAMQVKHLEYAVKIFEPDVLVSHELCLGPLILREKTGIPVGILGLATYLWPASTRLAQEAPVTEEEERLVWRHESMMDHYNQARALFQLPKVSTTYQQTPLVGDLFLLQSIPELEGIADALPSQVHLIGSCLWEPPSSEYDQSLNHLLAKAKTQGKPVLYVQPTRTFEQPSFWPFLIEALAEQPIRVVAAIGRMDCLPGELPSNFWVRKHISQGQVLPHAQGVLTGGHTTSILGAITHGLPSIIIPCGSGSEDISEHYERAGVALCPHPKSVNMETLKTAIHQILFDEMMHHKAKELQILFAQLKANNPAVQLLERLASTKCPVYRPEAA